VDEGSGSRRILIVDPLPHLQVQQQQVSTVPVAGSCAEQGGRGQDAGPYESTVDPPVVVISQYSLFTWSSIDYLACC
jgi:hypothetical protein